MREVADELKVEAEALFSPSHRHRAPTKREVGGFAPPRVWSGCGRSREKGKGHRQFAGYGWFTEGFDTADLKDAKVLLAELAPSATSGTGSD